MKLVATLMLSLNLREVIEGSVEMLGEKARKRGIDLNVFMPDDVPRYVQGDPVRIRQVIVNLVDNGLKFTKEGEVLVQVSCVENLPTEAVIKVEVRDTGIGVPEEVQRRLFEPFTQADASTTRRFGGTGLGLAICKQLTKRMGGEIGVESVPNEGATFWFTMKLSKQAAVPTDEVALDDVSLADFRMLVVDDNATNRKILSYQLANWNIAHEFAEDGFEALRMVEVAADRDQPYRVAIVDLQMPGMDGLEFVAKLRANPKYSGLKVIVLTSSGQRLPKKEQRKMGIAACLFKPYRQSLLYDCLVESALGPKEALATVSAPLGKTVPPAPTEDLGKGPDLRILVAEDNEINQKLTLLMLAKMGFSADIVANGVAVLDAVEAKEYDVILMDCQMPEMDGFDATRAIREKERNDGVTGTKALQIIAMTANAMRGDREKCLGVGMDDYLSKPIRKAGLLASLQKAAKRRDRC